MSEPIGYYITSDDAVCADDAPSGFADGDYSQWAGFRGWESPAAIFAESESDSPAHCGKCGCLIPHALTEEGLAYVAERLGSGLGDVSHDMTALSQWWDQYGDSLDEDQLKDIITEAIGQRVLTH